jgi:hypothetical protein
MIRVAANDVLRAKIQGGPDDLSGLTCTDTLVLRYLQLKYKGPELGRHLSSKSCRSVVRELGPPFPVLFRRVKSNFIFKVYRRVRVGNPKLPQLRHGFEYPDRCDTLRLLFSRLKVFQTGNKARLVLRM